MSRLSLSAPVEALRALAVPTADELAARQRPRARTDLEPSKGITQAELAARLGCPRTTVNAAEGRGAAVALDLLVTYADACGVALELRGVRK